MKKTLKYVILVFSIIVYMILSVIQGRGVLPSYMNGVTAQIQTLLIILMTVKAGKKGFIASLIVSAFSFISVVMGLIHSGNMASLPGAFIAIVTMIMSYIIYNYGSKLESANEELQNSIDEINGKNKELIEKDKKLTYLAYNDILTGLPNRHIAFVPAHSAEQLLLKVHPEETCVIQINNYIGYMLDEAEKLGFESILIFGHAGKLIKLAGNIMNTHSHIADCKNEIICTHSALSGASREIIQSLYDCKNISQSVQILEQNGLTCVWEKIAGKAVENCLARTHGKIKISIEIYNKETRLA